MARPRADRPRRRQLARVTTAGAGALFLSACGTGAGRTGSSFTEAPSPSTTQPGAVTTANPSGTTTTLPAGGTDLPASGTYVNGPAGDPHSYIVLSVSGTASVAGTANFVYQDGRETTEFSFSGTAGGGTAQLQSQGGGPGDFGATYTATTMTLQGCSSYLLFISSAGQCLFTLSATG